jgi:hypothetical protein
MYLVAESPPNRPLACQGLTGSRFRFPLSAFPLFPYGCCKAKTMPLA